MIYVAAWGMNVHVMLNRDYSSMEKGLTLGDLLIQKADQGVKVVIHLWKEGNVLGLDTQHTDWKNTKKFFKHTKVVIKTSFPADDEAGRLIGFFTHHEKFSICDVTDQNGKSKLVAFMGGFDLVKGSQS